MADDKYKPIPKKVNKPKPGQVKIINFQAMPVPGMVPGNINIIVFGLGDDEKIYQWNGDKQEWTYETTQ